MPLEEAKLDLLPRHPNHLEVQVGVAVVRSLLTRRYPERTQKLSPALVQEGALTRLQYPPMGRRALSAVSGSALAYTGMCYPSASGPGTPASGQRLGLR